MMPRLTHSIEIKASVEKVWELIVDVERWPGFLPTMSRIEMMDEPPLGLGSRALIKQPLLPSNVWTVISLEPPHLFRWRTGRGWIALIATHLIEPSGEGSRQTLILELEGRLAPLFAVATGWLLFLAIWFENQRFRQRAEGAP
jgi:hypothetical protein